MMSPTTARVRCLRCGQETRQPPYCIECDMTGGSRDHVRQIERSRPKGAPEHAWPRFPDYERHPTEIGRAPAWWSLYVLDEHWPIVVEVHVPSHKDLTGMTPREIRMVDPGPCRRVFHGTSREAAEAAFRLLCTTQATAPEGKP